MKRPSRLLILLLVLTIVCSFGYAAIESVHDCHGEECPICRIIAVISTLLLFFLIVCFVTILRAAALPQVILREIPSRDPETPIDLRVKMLN